MAHKVKYTEHSKRECLQAVISGEQKLLDDLQKKFDGQNQKFLMRGYLALIQSKDYFEKYLQTTQDDNGRT
jgi:hypothetical protein